LGSNDDVTSYEIREMAFNVLAYCILGWVGFDLVELVDFVFVRLG